RMGGQKQGARRVAAFSTWMETIPPVPAPIALDPSAAQRGSALFYDPAVGCAGCHSGPKLTNNLTINVGTGSAFQVPSLSGVWARAPYLHDGCATTLYDRFGACGGGDKHGHTSHLSASDIDDLVAYLETL